MMTMYQSLFLALTLFITSVHGQEVECKSGKVKGLTIETNGKKVNQYLGIPYAEPPVGELRFRSPKPKAPWPDVLDATKQPPLCPQIHEDNFKAAAAETGDKKEGVNMTRADPKKELDAQMAKLKITGGTLAIFDKFNKMSEKLGRDSVKGQEDCLFLNIFAPAGAKVDSKLAVVIFFHCGIFYSCGIRVPTFDGSILAAEGNIIVVTVQYRLGVYGFLHGATPEIPGNAGLRDQLESMKWVKDNIESFGGDPGKITIMGRSSGGWSAGFHLISPLSRPYFKQVIMESGSSLAPLMLFGEAVSRARFEKFAIAAKCPMGSKGERDQFALPVPGTYQCLAKLTREEVDIAQAIVLTSKKDPGFMPSEDSTKDICFFCANPFDIVKDGIFDPPGDVLFGTNSNEGGVFLANGMKDIYPPFEGEPKPMGLDDLVEEANKNGAGSNGGQMQMMLPMFFNGVDKKDPVAVRNRLMELISDALFVCPDQLLVTSLAKKAVAAWYYRFDYRPGKSYWNKWLDGALHMDEHQFVWGIPFREDAKDNYTDKDRKISVLMMKIWSAFIRDGNPVVEKKWKWKPNKGKDRGYILISAKAPKGQKGFPKNSCKDLTRYYPMGRSFLKNNKPS